MEHPIKIHDLGGFPPIFGGPPISEHLSKWDSNVDGLSRLIVSIFISKFVNIKVTTLGRHRLGTNTSGLWLVMAAIDSPRNQAKEALRNHHSEEPLIRNPAYTIEVCMEKSFQSIQKIPSCLSAIFRALATSGFVVHSSLLSPQGPFHSPRPQGFRQQMS